MMSESHEVKKLKVEGEDPLSESYKRILIETLKDYKNGIRAEEND